MTPNQVPPATQDSSGDAAGTQPAGTAPAKPTGFDALPAGILEHVFSYLNYVDRARAGGVCRKWRATAMDPRAWRRAVEVTYGPLPAIMRLQAEDAALTQRQRDVSGQQSALALEQARVSTDQANAWGQEASGTRQMRPWVHAELSAQQQQLRAQQDRLAAQSDGLAQEQAALMRRPYETWVRLYTRLGSNVPMTMCTALLESDVPAWALSSVRPSPCSLGHWTQVAALPSDANDERLHYVRTSRDIVLTPSGWVVWAFRGKTWAAAVSDAVDLTPAAPLLKSNRMSAQPLLARANGIVLQATQLEGLQRFEVPSEGRHQTLAPAWNDQDHRVDGPELTPNRDGTATFTTDRGLIVHLPGPENPEAGIQQAPSLPRSSRSVPLQNSNGRVIRDARLRDGQPTLYSPASGGSWQTELLPAAGLGLSHAVEISKDSIFVMYGEPRDLRGSTWGTWTKAGGSWAYSLWGRAEDAPVARVADAVQGQAPIAFSGCNGKVYAIEPPTRPAGASEAEASVIYECASHNPDPWLSYDAVTGILGVADANARRYSRLTRTPLGGWRLLAEYNMPADVEAVTHVGGVPYVAGPTGVFTLSNRRAPWRPTPEPPEPEPAAEPDVQGDNGPSHPRHHVARTRTCTESYV